MSLPVANAPPQRDSLAPPVDSSGGWSFLTSPWLWGGLLTLGVYYLIPFTGEYRPLLERYLCGHPLEYVQATLFFVGAAILIGRGLRLGGEIQAAALPLPVPPGTTAAAAAVAAIQHGLTQLPRRLRRTWFAERLADLADYLRYRPTAEGLEGQAQRLSEAAAERQQDGYAQVQTIIWAIPILGFLGTVMGITLAIANVTPEQLDTSLNSVTGGLAVAFDTTAVALSQSIVMVFAGFFVRRTEGSLLRAIDEKVFKGLVAPLAGAALQASPLLEAESRAARELLARTETLLDEQTRLWREAVEGLRTRWTETLSSQQQELAQALSSGVQANLGQHADLLAAVRQEFLSASEHILQQTLQQWGEARTWHAAQQAELRQTWEQTAQRFREGLVAERTGVQEELRQVLQGFAEQVQGVVRQLAETTSRTEAHLAAAARQTELLAQIAGREEELVELQRKLTENLETVQTAEMLQETLHSLNAAIHLLTARVRPKAA